MINSYKVSEKKQKLLDAELSRELVIGDTILVLKSKLGTWYGGHDTVMSCKIISIDGDVIKVTYDPYHTHTFTSEIKKSDIHSRETFYIGENPFEKEIDSTKAVAFTLESILLNLNIFEEKRTKEFNIEGTPIQTLNWNPFIFNKKKEKEFYQRSFVWTLDDKRSLIESIYEGIECGRILIRKRSWEELKEMNNLGCELAFNDLVDGKQRLNAIKGFMNGEFTDIHGNFFADLSSSAQRKFVNHQLFSYAEMPENSSDESVIVQFLKLNFAGVPQSKEHIEFVKSIRKNL